MVSFQQPCRSNESLLDTAAANTALQRKLGAIGGSAFKGGVLESTGHATYSHSECVVSGQSLHCLESRFFSNLCGATMLSAPRYGPQPHGVSRRLLRTSASKRLILSGKCSNTQYLTSAYRYRRLASLGIHLPAKGRLQCAETRDRRPTDVSARVSWHAILRVIGTRP